MDQKNIYIHLGSLQNLPVSTNVLYTIIMTLDYFSRK